MENPNHEELLKQLPEDFFKKFKDGKEFQGFMDVLFKRGVQELLEGELNEHLGYEKHAKAETGNTRNGKGEKRIKTTRGSYTIEVPRDRNSSFHPKLVPKRKRMIDHVEDVVIGLYAKGMSTEDISTQIKEIYGADISSSSVSNITHRILIDVEEWQKRALDSTYLIVWLDGIVFKVKQQNKIINKSIYIVAGLNTQGKKEVLGLWINEIESASFWSKALTDLRARGVEDILIACSDNLKGLIQAVKAVFPHAVTQLCIVHQIRNSLRYVPYKEKKVFTKDLRTVYAAINIRQAEQAFIAFEEKWKEKYPHVCRSWKNNWNELTPYFNYPMEIRTLIYTTNMIENLNRNVRKFTKNKTMFPDDQSVIKAVYLAVQHASKLWTEKIRFWPIIANQFLILYPDRSNIKI
ncbi:MAG TPA: IS256 family transposase [Bacteroidia bacterium]|nr:IS256 family transposase [Bacteroidia bacterium]